MMVVQRNCIAADARIEIGPRSLDDRQSSIFEASDWIGTVQGLLMTLLETDKWIEIASSTSMVLAKEVGAVACAGANSRH
jgi:hypothetical protein